MFCLINGRYCQHSGCTANHKICQVNNQLKINYHVDYNANTSLEERVRQLELQVQQLKQENQILRNNIMAASPYRIIP